MKYERQREEINRNGWKINAMIYRSITQSTEYRTREVHKLIKDLSKKWQAKTSAIKDKNGKPIMEREKVREVDRILCELYEITNMPCKESFLKELSEMTPHHLIILMTVSYGKKSRMR